MAWIESHQSVAGHPKTRRAARRLGVSIPTMVGHLHLLWHWALDYAQEGDLSKYDALDIADAAQWDGDPDQFIDALVNAGPGDEPGFLERDGDFGPPDKPGTGELVIRDWWDYAGKLIAKRQADAERKRQSRNETSTATPEDVQQTSSRRPTDGAGNRNLNQPTVNQPTETDKKATKKSSQSSAPVVVDSPYAVYVAFCEEIGADESELAPSFKSQQTGIAKQLIEDGFGEDRIRKCIRYLRSQDWRTAPIDLRTVKKEIGAWEANGEPATASKSKNGRSKNDPDYSGIDEFQEWQIENRRTS